jgi:hypothetical protein
MLPARRERNKARETFKIEKKQGTAGSLDVSGNRSASHALERGTSKVSGECRERSLTNCASKRRWRGKKKIGKENHPLKPPLSYLSTYPTATLN